MQREEEKGRRERESNGEIMDRIREEGKKKKYGEEGKRKER